jgi:hypothetical protein
MKDRRLTVEQFRGMGVSRDFAASPGEIENSTAESFLYQAGYLTLRPGTIDDYALDYPNGEVLASMSRLLIENIFSLPSGKNPYGGNFYGGNSYRTPLLRSLMEGNAEELVGEFNRLLAAIPYDDFSGAAKASVKEQGFDFSPSEWLYRSTLLAYLRGADVNVEAELHSRRGRADMVITHKGRVWVIELKIARGGADASQLAERALEQIIEKGYADRYGEDAILLGMAIDDDKRSVTAYSRPTAHSRLDP